MEEELVCRVDLGLRATVNVTKVRKIPLSGEPMLLLVGG